MAWRVARRQKCLLDWEGSNEKPIVSAGFVAPAPVFLATALAVDPLAEYAWRTSLLSFPYVPPLRAFIILVSVALAVPAASQLLRAGTAFDSRKPTTHIVTGGAFRVSRNPTYLLLALLLFGLALLLRSTWVLATAVLAVATTHWGASAGKSAISNASSAVTTSAMRLRCGAGSERVAAVCEGACC